MTLLNMYGIERAFLIQSRPKIRNSQKEWYIGIIQKVRKREKGEKKGPRQENQ